MSTTEGAVARNRTLPVILIAAVVQGWALYALHAAMKGQYWPASDQGWLLAFHAVAVLIPMTVQLLARSVRERSMWVIVAAMTVLFFYFGWHHGARVVLIAPARNDFIEEWLPLGFVLVVLWLMMLPFIQARIEMGRWRAPYRALFSNAWNNHLVLFEAAAFTGLFWLLLMLWQQLFFMLGIDYFRELFQQPLFIYPVTSITFGIALHLIGSLERLTNLVLEQVLSVLKWLLILAGIILALFSIALLAKLPGMIASGERAIGAAWLLWLVAVTVLLINAAYRDGSVERPYPRLIATGLRFIVPLTAVIAATAVYAMYLRVDRYGLTVDRVWACIVAAAALVYGVGYAFAARDKQWMASIARVNVIAALFLMSVIALSLTPMLSPHRIAASSQFERIVEQWPQATTDRADDPMRYLRFYAGHYGRRSLQRLAELENHTAAELIRKDAKLAMNQKHRWEGVPIDPEERISEMVIWPAGRSIDPPLRDSLKAEFGNAETQGRYQSSSGGPLHGVFIDMDDRVGDEFVVVTPQHASVFQQENAAWRRAGGMTVGSGRPSSSLSDALKADDVRTTESRWKSLRIGDAEFQFVGE